MNAPVISSIIDLGPSIQMSGVGGDVYIVGKSHLINILKNTKGTLRAWITTSGDPENLYPQNQFEITASTTFNGDSYASLADLIEELSAFVGGASAGGSSSSVSAEYKSPVDFVATYTSASTITLSELPGDITDSTQIVYIKRIPSTDAAEIFVNGSEGYTFRIASNVITAYFNDEVVDLFASGDLYEIGLNLQTKAYDPTVNSHLNTIISPIPQAYTDVETIVSAKDLTSGYVDFGPEIDMRGYTKIGLFIEADTNNSTDVIVKVVGLKALGGSEFTIIGTDDVTLWTTSPGVDLNLYAEFEVGTIPYVQIQAKAGTVGATAGDLTIGINKVR